MRSVGFPDLEMAQAKKHQDSLDAITVSLREFTEGFTSMQTNISTIKSDVIVMKDAFSGLKDELNELRASNVANFESVCFSFDALLSLKQ